jgi:hypothetical protein
VTVTEYIERARQAAELAEQMPSERARLLEIAEAWLMLADEAAKEAAEHIASQAENKTTNPDDKPE